MAVTMPPAVSSHLLTYEKYMTEGITEQPAYILDGNRCVLAAPGGKHQRISGNVQNTFRTFEESTGIGYTLYAPYDILLRCKPLRTRQPDLLFISKARVEQNGAFPKKAHWNSRRNSWSKLFRTAKDSRYSMGNLPITSPSVSTRHG